MTTGQNIRALRKLRGMTQLELANRVGVTSTSVSEWERDKNEPRAYALNQVAEALGVSMERLRKGPSAGDREHGPNVPVYASIAVDTPIEENGVIGFTWARPDVVAAHPGCYFLRVNDGSMDAVYWEGSLVLVDEGLRPANGDFAVVHIAGGDAVVRRMNIGRSTVTFTPVNRAHSIEDVVLPKGDDSAYRVRGLVVWHLIPFGDEFGNDYPVVLPADVE